MALLLSIGNDVSFFYQLQAGSHTSFSFLAQLCVNQRYVFSCQNESLYLYSSHALELKAAQAFSLNITPKKACIRLFGQGLNDQNIALLFQQFFNGVVIESRVFSPHPLLANAFELLLSNELDADTLEKLNRFALAYGLELVYLTHAPSISVPGLLVMDMDSTAIEIECIDEIAKFAGVGEQVAAITAKAMNGELDFAQSLMARVLALKGADEAILKKVLDSAPLMAGLESLVSHLKDNHWQVAIASGGFTYFTQALKHRLGLTATFANELEIINAKLTGKVLGDIVDAKAKAAVVRELASTYSIKPSQTVAIGDGANDIPMLKEVALGVAFHAKASVQAQAKAAIRQGSLLQLLYLFD